MAEYIERKALLEVIAERNRCTCNAAMSCLQMKRMVENIPAADVAPVVRCKGCMHSYEDISGLCCSHGFWVDCTVPEIFFCASGEQKDGGAENASNEM